MSLLQEDPLNPKPESLNPNQVPFFSALLAIASSVVLVAVHLGRRPLGGSKGLGLKLRVEGLRDHAHPETTKPETLNPINPFSHPFEHTDHSPKP